MHNTLVMQEITNVASTWRGQQSLIDPNSSTQDPYEFAVRSPAKAAHKGKRQRASGWRSGLPGISKPIRALKSRKVML